MLIYGHKGRDASKCGDEPVQDVIYRAVDSDRYRAVRGKLAREAIQFLAECGALISAANWRLEGLSSPTIAGVAKRGRHKAASLVVAAEAVQVGNDKRQKPTKSSVVVGDRMRDRHLAPC